MAAFIVATTLTATDAQAAAHIARMTGVTTIVTSHSLSLPFLLNRAGTLDIQKMTVRGSGRVYGVAIRHDGSGSQPTVFGLDDGYCTKPGCPSLNPGAGVWCSCGNAGPGVTPPASSVLPAGRYHVYVIADGGTTTVTFRITGAAGASRWTGGPSLPVAFSSPAADSTVPTTAPQSQDLYSAGAQHTIGARGGFAYLGLWKILMAAPESANGVGVCGYRGAVPTGPFAPYQVGCEGTNAQLPLASGQYATGTVGGPGGTLPRYYTSLDANLFLGPGHYGLGGYIDGATPSVEGHATILWFDRTA